MYWEYHPVFTHGGWFGGIGRGDVWGDFWGPIRKALNAWYGRPNEDFVNASGKTDYQEDYEWRQHQKAWAEYVAYQLTKQANETLPSSPSDPKLVYNRKYQTMGLFVWYEKGKVWVLIRLMDATDGIANWAGTETPCGVQSALGTFKVYAPEWRPEYGGWVFPTSSLGPLRPDGTRWSNLIHASPDPDVFNEEGGYDLEGTCGCIRISNYDMDWLINYYWEHALEPWSIEWRNE